MHIYVPDDLDLEDAVAVNKFIQALPLTPIQKHGVAAWLDAMYFGDEIDPVEYSENFEISFH